MTTSTATTSLTIGGSPLSYQHIVTISATSTVELVERDGGYNTYTSLLIDGTHYDLIMSKHLIGRPEAEAAVEAALEQVRAAIAALQSTPAPTFVKSIMYDKIVRDYRMELNGELVGFARNYTEAETTLNTLVLELIQECQIGDEDAGEAGHLVAA